MELNLNSLTVDANGRVSFSGLSSGIDFQATVDAIIAARRIPVDTIEARVLANTDKITALRDLRTQLNALAGAVGKLRGAVSADSTSDIFKTKSAFATTSRSDGGTPAAAGNLIGVSVENSATLGSHTIEVLRVATAHKVMSDAQTSSTTALSLTGTFTVNGTSITVSATDTLQDVRDRINNANTGTTPTGVSASIVSVSATENHLVLTADDTGTTMTLADTTGTPLDTLGVLTGASIKNELVRAENARLKADGFVDIDRFETDFVSSSTAALSTTFTTSTYPGTFTVNGNLINYDNTSTLTSIAADIDLIAGISSQVIQDGSGFRLEVTEDAGGALTFVDTTGFLADLGLNNEQIFERTNNTISDLFTGVTFTLFNAEEDTNIKIDLDQDLSSVKTEIDTFVEAYNAVRVLLNQHSLIDPNTGEASEESGVLFGSTAIRDIHLKLGTIIGSGTLGVDSAFSALAQIGINFVNNTLVGDPLFKDTLEIDDSVIDAALLNNPDDVRRLFSFDFTSSDPSVVLLGYGSETTYDAAGYTLNVNFDDTFDSDRFVIDSGALTETVAKTTGPALDGISAIAYADTVLSGNAYRYSYDGTVGGENLTLYNLTAGTNEVVDISSILDAVAGAAPADLGAGQTATVNFATSGVTFTLTGDGTGFARATVLDNDGALDISASVVAGTANFSPATATTTYDTDGGVSNTGVAALSSTVPTAGISYVAATGLLHISFESDGANTTRIRNGTGSGVSFQIDGAGGFSENGTTLADLEDGASHFIEVQVGGEIVARVDLGIVTTTAVGTDSEIAIDLGEGLFSEVSTLKTKDTPMSNYLPALTGGTIEVQDAALMSLGVFAFNATDSLQTVADTINADPDLNASIIENVIDNTFRLNITDLNHNVLTFVDGGGGNLDAQITMDNVGDGVFSANIGGGADGTGNGSVTVSGRSVTATAQTGADGLKFFFTGGADISAITLSYTVGIAAQLFGAVTELADLTSGSVSAEIEALEGQNTFNNDRVEEMLVRIEIERQNLLDRFIRMEAALASLESVKQSIALLTDSIFGRS